MSTAGTLRRNERKVALAWLGAGVLLLLVLAAWGVALNGAERLVEALDRRWERHLERGEQLWAAGRFEEAALHLALLDREHPAIFVKHRLDTQRERVLELLARSHLALDNKLRALDAARRLAAFDPLNWKNHFLLAELAEHFGEGDAADLAYARVLELYPSHLPSVSGRIALAHDAGRYAEVPPLYEAYLDAWRVARCSLETRGARAEFDLLVDGQAHPVEAVFTDLDSAALETEPDRIALDTGGYAIRLERFELVGAPRVGTAGGAPTSELPPEAWKPSGARLLASDPSAPSASRARLSVAAYKPLPAELWELVERSYRNTLDHEGLAAARARSLIGAPDAPLQLVD